MKNNAVFHGLCFFLAVLILITGIPHVSPVYAQETVTGKVTISSKVNVRTGPGTNYAVLSDSKGEKIQLTDGFPVTVGESVESEDEKNPGFWYEISFTYENSQYTGYIYSVYITIDKTDTDIVISQDFEKLIESLPESYKDPLRVLHTLHPSWQFKILNTGLDWNTVLDNQCVYGRSLINSSILSQRSTDPSCYNWLTDTYTAIEGAKWFQASRETIAYYMDPRNFLTEENLFQFEALSYEKSTQSIEGVQKILANSFMADTKISDGTDMLTYAQVYMKAAALSNVSPYHLAARTIQEVGRNGGKGTSGKTEGYEGYYNFYNIGANTGVMAGLKYAMTGGSLSAEQKAKYMLPWNSPYKAIVGGGIFIGTNYINRGQNTLYLEKFDVEPTNGLYWHQYMANVAAAYSEGRNIYSTYKAMGLLDTSLTFIIPVFDNMPQEACPLPTKTGSINNHLSALTVGELPLTPTFSHDQNTYSIVLEDTQITQVTITATPVTQLAKVTGHVGAQELKPGLNTFTIKVTAENGDVNHYTVYVATSADLIPTDPPVLPPDGPETPVIPPDPPKPTGSYTLALPQKDGYVYGITPGTTVKQLLSQFTLTGDAAVTVTDATGKTITEGTVGNNMTLTVSYDNKTAKLITRVYGDPDGDGTVTAIDLLMVRRHILGTFSLEGNHQTAADADRDGTISAIDLLMIRRHILGTYAIEQK